jgi:arylformamidase
LKILPEKETLMKILDISVPVSRGLPVWPGDSRIVLERSQSIANGNESNDSQIVCSVHSGTHVDAPKHYVDDGSTVEKLPLDVLLGPAWVVQIPTEDIITPKILEKLAIAPDTNRLLFKTRNSSFWENPNHNFKSEYVALSPEAARWIVSKGIGLVGIDYLSVQMLTDSESLTHRILLKAGVVIIESLDLRLVQPGLYQLICLPLKLVGSDGAPARVVLIEK